MRQLSDDRALYHGSYTEVSNPDLTCCAQHKDFGQGLYLTTSKAQAKSFAKLSTRKAKENGIIDISQDEGVVSAFRLESPQDRTLTTKLFSSADAEWLRCITAHRRRGN